MVDQTPVLDPDNYTPAADTPTLTSAAVGASAATTVAGSAGWLREKRVGVAENVPGASQTSTAALDVTGSTRFAYPGVPSGAGFVSNPGQYVDTPFKPGGSSQNAYWLFSVAFLTDSPVVQLRFNAPTTNPSSMIRINGRRLQDQSEAATSAAGSGYGWTLTFPSAGTRHIRLDGMQGGEGRWGGVAVASGYTATKPSTTYDKTVAVIGDSYSNGAGSYPNGANPMETFIWRLAGLMGADNVIACGIGGTGWNTEINSDPNSLFSARVAPVMAFNPDVLVWVGGRNDSANPTGLQSAVESTFSSAQSYNPNIPMYVVHSSTNTDPVNSQIQAACANYGVTYLNVDVDSLPKISDGIHPTYAGHVTLANESYALMAPATPAVTGTTAANVGMTGAAITTGIAAGVLAAAAAMSGVAVPVATVIGSMAARVASSSSTVPVGKAVGVVGATTGLHGTPTPVATVTGSTPLTARLTGSAAALVNTTGTLPLTIGATGSAQQGNINTGTITLETAMHGAATPVAVATGNLPLTVGATGTVAQVPTATTTGQLPVTVQLFATATPVAVATGRMYLSVDATQGGTLKDITVTATLDPRPWVASIGTQRWAGALT